ncbi:MAG: glycoside hydrolase family 3 C-terminal domain-containing protein [Patescibacteria group bacterium]
MPQPAYLDTTLPLESRVDDLVSRMTLAEKASQMLNSAPAIPRLGVPEYDWWNECLHGVAWAGIATVFPQAIGLAAAWDADLLRRVATAVSDEARAKHHEAERHGVRGIFTGLTFWSPNINIFRDPRWGRGQETYGEDPFLASVLGVAFVRGLQGDDRRYLKLVATPKHYAVHSGPEAERHRFDARVDERDLRLTYLPAFEACVREGRAASVMGAYNRTNGEPCCASRVLLQEILRGEWGFDGYVVSDCGAICDIHRHHRLVETAPEAAALAVRAGCDLNCGDTYGFLVEAVEKGLIAEADLDVSLRRLFTARFRLGLFDPPQMVPYAQIPYEVNDCPAHRELALEAARASIVLLKNDSLLPLAKDLKAVAVIGPNADNPAVLLGNYNGTPASRTTLLEGIRAKLPDGARLYHAHGCELAPGWRPMAPVPSTSLRPYARGDGGFGLNAAYHAGLDFGSPPVLERVDAMVDFAWRGRSPLTGREFDHFAVRWEGWLVPPVTGSYRLGVNGTYEYHLFLDGERIASLQHQWGAAESAREVELEAGRYYHLRLDYQHRGLDPQVRLVWSVPGADYRAEALAAAARAEVVILALGISPDLEGEEKGFSLEGFACGDRTEIGLPRPQEELLRAICGLGKPVAVVLFSGSALAVNYAHAHAAAVVQAWYPGQAGGEAVADVLFGDHNPSGRLPVTFYKSVDQLPPFEDYAMRSRTYRYFEGEPLYPFGYGLSYTRFAYSGLSITPEKVRAGGEVAVSAAVRNTGAREGCEVVQLYVSDLAASVPVPLRQLAGFARVRLESGEEKRVTFTLSPRQLSVITDDGRRVVEPGEFAVFVGGGQPGFAEGVAGRFAVEGEAAEIPMW